MNGMTGRLTFLVSLACALVCLILEVVVAFGGAKIITPMDLHSALLAFLAFAAGAAGVKLGT